MSFACLLPFLLIITSNVLNVRSARIDPVISYEASPSAGASVNYTIPSAIPKLVAAESSLFPDESIMGYAGPTPTGDEPFAIATARVAPFLDGNYPLVAPPVLGSISADFDIFEKWGNLGPAKSIPSLFVPGSSALIPEGCQLEQVHHLFRHGARYPSTGSAPASFAQKLENVRQNGTGFTATGILSFLNTWTYKLGAEILIPFGRQQLYRMGVKHAIQYGQLLESEYPLVFRTTSEDRMVESMKLYAEGLLGRDATTASNTVLIIEENNFNNTLAPYGTCNNSNNAISYIGSSNVTAWQNLYLKDAYERLSALIDIELEIEDLYTLQQLCAYETVALGFSSFCDLFTEKEWDGFEYTIDLTFLAQNSFGNPASAAMGLGYLQEHLARLTGNPIPIYNSTTNSTLDSSNITFPLNLNYYADASHDTIISTIVVALNFTSLATEILPSDQIPPNRSFRVNQIAPFATELTAQVMSCPSSDPEGIVMESYVRWLLNDAVVPLTGLNGCTYDPDGLCKKSTYVSALMQRNAEIDWNYSCLGQYNVTYGDVLNGQPPY